MSPASDSQHHVAREGNLVLLLTEGDKRYLIQLRSGRTFHSHLGLLHHDALIGQPLGITVTSQLGHSLLLLDPSLDDLISRIRRSTQIIYPKDAAYIVHRLNLRAGSRVIEAGTGSGGLTIALAHAVAPEGRVYTYEAREENAEIARENLERTNLLAYVDMFSSSIRDGFHQVGVDGLILDLRTPWLFIEQVRSALRPGGFFAALLPTTNQVSELLATLEPAGFADISVEELLLRKYKPVPDRLRPDDSMIGHTGFLVFARPVVDRDDPTRWLSKARKRYRARQKMEEKLANSSADESENQKRYPRLPLP